MNEEKVLLNITDNGESMCVDFRVKNARDLFNISTAIARLLVDNPSFAAGLMTVTKLMEEDEEFRTELEKCTVDLTQFENILKNE
jgi:hypothetical protein